jgi:cationic peptide transport system ATP-binding protein
VYERTPLASGSVHSDNDWTLQKVRFTARAQLLLPSYAVRRTKTARALILNPQVIVADESFAALDPCVRSQTVNLLMKLQKELGLGFIFISHNLTIVRHVSDKILIMQRGMVVESGKTEVISNWPKSEYTQKLVKAHQGLLTRQST